MGPEYGPLGLLGGFWGPLKVHIGYIVGIRGFNLGVIVLGDLEVCLVLCAYFRYLAAEPANKGPLKTDG